MPRYIDQDKIYDATNNGRRVFEYYFPHYDFGKRPAQKIKLRAEEKTASAMISFYQNHWRITDFGNQGEYNGMKAVPFVMKRENIGYHEALGFIEEVILKNTVSSEWKPPKWIADYDYREMGPEDRKGSYNFVYKEDSEITRKELDAFGRYVSVEHLRHFNCKALKYYEYCGMSSKLGRDVVHKFTATEDFPMFVFDYGKFQKVYKPHAPEKKNRFMYVGEKEKNFIYGLNQLQHVDNEFESDEDDDDAPTRPKDKPRARVRDLFRCSGESDALNLHSLGYHVYWLNSETADLTWAEYKQVDDLCQHHYQIMDLDATGRAMALKNAVKYINLFTIEMPEWLEKKRDYRGNPCKDLKDFINLAGDNWDATREQFRHRQAKARRVKFWEKSDKGEYNLNMEYYYFFLKANGFYQMDYRHMKNTTYCYVQIVGGKIVKLIHPEDIKRVIKKFTKDWVMSKNLPDEISILNKLTLSSQISEANIDTMESIEVELRNASAEAEYLHFNNSSLRITKNAIERIRHEDVPNYILGSITVKNQVISHVIPHNISLQQGAPAIEVEATPGYQELLDRLAAAATAEERERVMCEISLFPEIDRYEVKINDKEFIFASFLRDITRMHWRRELEDKEPLTDTQHKEEMLALANMLFCIGYLCAQYKNHGKPWLVFIQDTKISEVGKSEGRSGKSLILKGISHARVSFYIEGRKLDDKSQFQFLYDGLTEFHDIVDIDDFAEFGDFNTIYSQITSGRVVNSKHTSPFTLPYEDSGKMSISSNFELPNTSSSTMARLLSCGVSDFYHEQTKNNNYKESRSPLSKFGRQLYTDFTEDEWVQFFNLIAYCIQLQQRFDKIQPPMENLERRQLRREMGTGLGRGEDFLRWADDHIMPWGGEGSKPVRTPDDSDTFYLDTLFDRKVALAHFLEESGISDAHKRSYSAQKFKTHLDAWSRYHGFVLNPPSLCNQTNKREKQAGRIISRSGSSTVEYFYISTQSTDAAAVPEVVMTEMHPDLPF